MHITTILLLVIASTQAYGACLSEYNHMPCLSKTEMEKIGFGQFFNNGEYCFDHGGKSVCFINTGGSIGPCSCGPDCRCGAAEPPNPTPPELSSSTCYSKYQGKPCRGKSEVGPGYHSFYTTGDYCFPHQGKQTCFFDDQHIAECDCTPACNCDAQGSTEIALTCHSEVSPVAFTSKYCSYLGSKGEPNSYCIFTNMSTDHSVCKFGLSQDEKDKILAEHNRLRAYVASGQETKGSPGPQKPATNMATLKWNEDLAEGARRVVSQLKFKHDANRKTPTFNWVGQNLYTNSRKPNEWDSFQVEEAVQSWYDEVEDMNGNVHIFSRDLLNVGHYTQLVWGNTEEVGCAAIEYIEDDLFRQIIGCNYGPGGNLIGGTIYKTM